MSAKKFFFFWIWVPLLVAFAILMRLDKSLKGKKLWYPVALFLGVPFLVLDVLYNWLFGTIIWWEFPKEFLYTDRLKRKKLEGYEDAFEQCRMLNKFDPDHC